MARHKLLPANDLRAIEGVDAVTPIDDPRMQQYRKTHGITRERHLDLIEEVGGEVARSLAERNVDMPRNARRGNRNGDVPPAQRNWTREERAARIDELQSWLDETVRDSNNAESYDANIVELGAHRAEMEALESRDTHLSALAHGVRGGRTEAGSDPGRGSDGWSVPTAGPSDILDRSQSVSDWARHKGITRGYDGMRMPSFDSYLRRLLSGQPLSRAEEERALSEGTLTAGGHLVPTPLATEVIDLARNAMKTQQAGVRTVPMTSNTLKVPRLTSEGTPAWHAENAPITSADMVFDAVTFDAQTLTRLVVLSIELFEDSDPSAEGVIAQSFAAQIALEVDRAVLRGSGTAPEPRGVLNQTGVTLTTHGANGATIANYDFWLDAVGTVRNNNFEPTAFIQAPRSETSLSKLKEATTNAYLRPPAALDSIPRLNSKQIPITLTVGTSTDCSELYTGQWDMCMLGVRTSLRILPLRERFIDNGQYGFLAWLRADVQLAQPAAFNVDTGVRS